MNDTGLVEVPMLKLEEDYRKETFEDVISDYNFAERTVKGDRLIQVLRLKFRDGPALDLFGVPDDGSIESIKSFQDFGRFIAVLQSKGLKVNIRSVNGKFSVFQISPGIGGSKVKMMAIPREYMKADGETGTSLNWRMEILQLNSSAEEGVNGFVSSPNAPQLPPKEDTVGVLEDTKNLILEILEGVKKENPEKWIPINEIIKAMRLKFKDQPDAEKKISSYAKLREKALKELEEDCMIEFDGKALYKIM